MPRTLRVRQGPDPMDGLRPEKGFIVALYQSLPLGNLGFKSMELRTAKGCVEVAEAMVVPQICHLILGGSLGVSLHCVATEPFESGSSRFAAQGHCSPLASRHQFHGVKAKGGGEKSRSVRPHRLPVSIPCSKAVGGVSD